MHGLGNDFIIFDNQRSTKINDANFLRKISDRDLVLARSGNDYRRYVKPRKFKIKMYNSDGTETGACGNGSRCIAICE